MQGAFTPVLASVWIGWLVGKPNQIAATQNVHITHRPVGICWFSPKLCSSSSCSSVLIEDGSCSRHKQTAPEFVWRCTDAISSRRSRYACSVCFWCQNTGRPSKICAGTPNTATREEGNLGMKRCVHGWKTAGHGGWKAGRLEGGCLSLYITCSKKLCSNSSVYLLLLSKTEFVKILYTNQKRIFLDLWNVRDVSFNRSTPCLW